MKKILIEKENFEEDTIMVCHLCGKHGDETIIEGYSSSIYHVNRHGESDCNKFFDYGKIDNWYCCNCSCETELITLEEFRLQPNKGNTH
jgi:hypothetical protein